MRDAFYRWQYLTGLLRRQAAGDTPANVLDATRARVRRFYEDAEAQMVHLPHPGFEDLALAGLEFVADGAGLPVPQDDLPPLPNEIVPETAHIPSLTWDTIHLPKIWTPEQAARHRAAMERRLISARRAVKELTRALTDLNRREKSMALAKAEGRQYRPGNVKKRRRPGPCWCGCGGKTRKWKYVNKVSRFIPGHAKRYEGYILRVERREMTREELPELLRTRLKWVRCRKCGGWIPNVDPLGRPIEKQIGLACWREGYKVQWPYSVRVRGTAKEV